MSASDPNLMFHLQRSRCIDAFARAEAAIAFILRRHITLTGKELLGHNLVKLRDVPAKPTYSKAARTQVRAALEKLEPLLLVRNDLVHAQLSLLKGNGCTFVSFINSRLPCDKVGIPARLMTSEALEQLEKSVIAIAVKLETAAQPPRTSARKLPSA